MRRPSSIVVIIVSCLALGFVYWHLIFGLSAAAQSGQSPELVRTSNPVPHVSKPGDPPALVAPIAPPGTALYAAKRGDTVTSVAHHFLSQTSYLTSSELADAIRKVSGNPQGTYLKPGQQLVVPGILAAPIVEKTIPVPRDFEVRAVYLTGLMAGSDHGLRIIRRWRELGGNAVVFDVKDSDGSVNIPFDHPLASGHHAAIHDLPKFTHFLHSQGLHAIARVAIFRDERLVVAHPELAVKSHKTGQACARTESWYGPILRNPRCRNTILPWPRRQPNPGWMRFSLIMFVSRLREIRKTPASCSRPSIPNGSDPT